MEEVAERRSRRHTLKQLSVFMPNQLGSLLQVTRVLDAFRVTIRAVNIVDAADHAVARLLVNKPDLAREALVAEGYSVAEAELVAVQLPPANSGGIRRVLSALLMAELNVHYVYSLLTAARGVPVLALHVEDLDAAAQVLEEHGMELVGQDELA